MSEEDRSQDQESRTKLSLPKSLEGEEDAEVTWEIITKRYPKVAPLLCEMESAIDRAENLLQELRSPYTQALGSSSTVEISDSLEEVYPDGILSSYQSQGIQEDFQERNVRHWNDYNGYGNRYSIRQISKRTHVETQVTKEYLPSEEDANTECITSKSIEEDYVEEEEIEAISSRALIQAESDDRNQRETDGQDFVRHIEDSPRIFTAGNEERSTKSDRMAKNTFSLDGWAKVVGEEVMHSLYPTAENALMLNEDQDDDRATSFGSNDERRQDTKELRKMCFSSKNYCLHQVITVQGIQEEDQSVTHAKTISTVGRVVDTRKQIDTELKADTKDIMEGIVNQPEISVSIIESKTDGEFRDRSPGRMKNFKTLEIDKGNGDESISDRGSPSHVVALYKLCEKEKAPEPNFNLSQKMNIGGFKYNATCKALDLISHGSGKNAVDARREAAKALIEKYRKLSKNPSKEN